MENQPYQYTHEVQNLGTVIVKHSSRNEKEKYDVMQIVKDKKVLVEVKVPFDTRPVNAFKLIDSAIESLDYTI